MFTKLVSVLVRFFLWSYIITNAHISALKNLPYECILLLIIFSEYADKFDKKSDVLCGVHNILFWIFLFVIFNPTLSNKIAMKLSFEDDI